MKGFKKKVGLLLAVLLVSLGVGVLCSTETAHAADFDDARDFYNEYGSQIVFKDGYFYYATRGKIASSSKNTTHWRAIGYRMRVRTSSETAYIYFSYDGWSIGTVDNTDYNGHRYCLRSISLEDVKWKLASENYDCYEEFIQDGGHLLVDGCMITVSLDGEGNETENGSMDDWGNFYGDVYTDYSGIAGAAPWGNPSSLHSYFNKTINYETNLKLKQKIYVRYQNADGTYGRYSKVLDEYYVYGEMVDWWRDGDDCYEDIYVYYEVISAETTYVDIDRKKYLQRVYVSYMDEEGNYGEWELADSEVVRYGNSYSWSYDGSAAYDSASVERYTVTEAEDHYIYIGRKSYTQNVYARYMDSGGEYGEYELVKSQSINYGGKFSWSYGGSACYNSASVAEYTVTEDKDNYVSISRKKYTVSLSEGTGISSVTGEGDYYYGASCTVAATVKTGYTWKNWSGDRTSTSKEYSFRVYRDTSLTANARANVYYIEFHANGGLGTMEKLTCSYDRTYTLPAMAFDYPEEECIYIGWNTNADSFSREYREGQRIRNLTAEDGYTFHFYAIWDYAPELSTKERYFTLYEARNGVITAAELLRTAVSYDREDGITSVVISNYSPDSFTGMIQDGFVEVEYETRDSRGNVIRETAIVTVVDTGNTSYGRIDDDGSRTYARFISSSYWQKSYGTGGLESASKWRREASFESALRSAMSNAERDTPMTQQVWVFTGEDIAEVKQYVTANGFGNSKDENALSRFINNFRRCKQ